MYTVDLNSDLGESFGNYKIGNDDKVIPLISSANVACGYHASDPVVMGNTLAMAREAGIRIGAHPGFPDLMGFGRRNLSVSRRGKSICALSAGCTGCILQSNRCKNAACKASWSLI